MDSRIASFIENNIELIDENKFEDLFAEALRCLTISEVPQLSKALLDAGINVLSFVNRIPSYFYAGLAIEEMTIPSHINNIGGGAFRESEIMEIHFEPSSNLKCISACAFSDCQGLTSIEIPDSVTIIGTQIFKGCHSLEKVKVPETLTSIPAGAFYDCINLKEINIPMNCDHIGTKAFYNCEDVKLYVPKGKKSIKIDNETAEWFKAHAVFY